MRNRLIKMLLQAILVLEMCCSLEAAEKQPLPQWNPQGLEFQKEIPDHKAFDLKLGVEGRYYLPIKRPALQSKIDELLEIIFESKKVQQALGNFLIDPYYLRFHFGMSTDSAKRILHKAELTYSDVLPYRAFPYGASVAHDLFVTKTSALYSEKFVKSFQKDLSLRIQDRIDDAKKLLKTNFPEDVQQLFRNKISFVAVDDLSQYCFSSWSDDYQNTVFALGPEGISSLELIQGLLHEMAVRKDMRIRPLGYLDRGQEVDQALLDAAQNETLQYALVMARAFHFEAITIKDILDKYEGSPSQKLMTFPQRLQTNCSQSIEELIDISARDLKVDSSQIKSLWQKVANRSYRFGGVKMTLCQHWSDFELSSPISFAGGGPRPRCDGW